MAKELEHRVALVTGASAGIGRATALALAEAGAAVVVSARRGERLRAVVGEIEAGGGRAAAVPADAAREEDVEALVGEAAAFATRTGGVFDTVIVNAGRGLAGGLLSSDAGQWRAMYDLNVLGAAALMRRAGERFVAAGRGDIVVLGSVSGHNVSPFSGFYGSTKFAVAGMAEGFRREVCGRGVRVTVVMPGIVLSEFQEAAGYTRDSFYKGVERYGKLLSPADVAGTIRFIVSQPPHVPLNEVVIRPTGQDYP